MSSRLPFACLAPLVLLGCLVEGTESGDARSTVDHEDAEWEDEGEVAFEFASLVPVRAPAAERTVASPAGLERVTAVLSGAREIEPVDVAAVTGPDVRLKHPEGEARVELLDPSVAVSRDGWLYVGYRTSSVVVRFVLDAADAVVRPPVGELIAVFEPWDPARNRSAGLVDLAFDSKGALFASCASEGRIWRIGVPDPTRPFYGDDQGERPTSAPPYLDLRERIGAGAVGGKLLFDAEDRLHVRVDDAAAGDGEVAVGVYRAVPVR
ncbi:MAG: hypothetical protein ACF8XB_13200 [Planctomycetota bacterium JB042]